MKQNNNRYVEKVTQTAIRVKAHKEGSKYAKEKGQKLYAALSDLIELGLLAANNGYDIEKLQKVISQGE